MQRMFSGYNEMRLEINDRKKLGEFTSMWKLADFLVTDEPNKSQGELENVLRWMKMKIYPNLWDAAKAALRGKLTAINTYTKNEGNSQISYLTFHVKTVWKQIKSKLSRMLKII